MLLIITDRGKLLGGSSALNYMGWDRGSKEEYDAWKLLGDSEGGWDWDALLPFLVKPEDAAPASVNPDLAIEYSASDAHVFGGGVPPEVGVGVGGPVKVGKLHHPCVLYTNHHLKLSYNGVYSDAIPPYVKAWNSLNQHTNSNPVRNLLALHS